MGGLLLWPGLRPVSRTLRGGGGVRGRGSGEAGRSCRVHGAASCLQWIMDVLICNGLGIYCGMKTLKWLSLKTYKWQGLWNIPTYKYVCRVWCCRAWALGWGLEGP